MRVAVTGGTGFIGGHLLEALAARGDDIVSIERPGSARRGITGLPLRVIHTPLDDAAALAGACAGAEVIYHLAGLTQAPGAAEYQRVNVEGTAAVMRAAAAQGAAAPLVILLSSFSAGGPCRGGAALTPRDAPCPVSRYGESKLRAEAVVHGWNDRVPAIVLRPTSVYGPRERGLFRYFRLVRHGIAVAVGDWQREVQLLHVRDLVRVLLRVAAHPGAAGRTWYVAHPEVITWRHFADTLGRVLGRPPRRLRLPVAVAGALAGAAELTARLRGRTTGLNRDRVRELAGRWVSDAAHTWQTLDLQPEVSLDEGVAETVAWYHSEGWL